jgi:hypothetical protein
MNVGAMSGGLTRCGTLMVGVTGLVNSGGGGGGGGVAAAVLVRGAAGGRRRRCRWGHDVGTASG